MYIFLEGLRDFIELSHPRVREFRVSHLSINKGLLQAVLGMRLGELLV